MLALPLGLAVSANVSGVVPTAVEKWEDSVYTTVLLVSVVVVPNASVSVGDGASASVTDRDWDSVLLYALVAVTVTE